MNKSNFTESNSIECNSIEAIDKTLLSEQTKFCKQNHAAKI